MQIGSKKKLKKEGVSVPRGNGRFVHFLKLIYLSRELIYVVLCKNAAGFLFIPH
jgi:hypothetical protein